MEKKEHTIAEQFLARRIAEFPTLYHCNGQVISSCILSTQGSCAWNKVGSIVHHDSHYNERTKKWGRYPLRMPIETAFSLHHSIGKNVHFSYDYEGPINHIPLNAEQSWLKELESFLWTWTKISLDDYKIIAEANCLLYYGIKKNPHAGLPERTIADFALFLKKAPSWQAKLQEVRYYQEHKHIDVRTFQGIDI